MDEKELTFVLRTLVRHARGQQDIGALDHCLQILPQDERETTLARQAAEREELEKRHALERAS